MDNWLGIASFGVNILVLLSVVAGFIKVLRNDLFHLTADVSEIKCDVKEMKENQVDQGNRLTAMEVKCRERHQRKHRNKIK